MSSQLTFFSAEADFRRWLQANHTTAPELLVGFWKMGGGKSSIDRLRLDWAPAFAGAQT